MMDISVMSIFDAKDFVPQVPTYVIRIFDSNGVGEELMKIPMQDSPLFTVRQYVFDDIPLHAYNCPEEFNRIYERIRLGKAKSLSRSLATKIIWDFSQAGKSSASLLVHCTYGMNRSPAVAMALNDIFDLGHHTQSLRELFPCYNAHVYKTMMVAAKRK